MIYYRTAVLRVQRTVIISNFDPHSNQLNVCDEQLGSESPSRPVIRLGHDSPTPTVMFIHGCRTCTIPLHIYRDTMMESHYHHKEIDATQLGSPRRNTIVSQLNWPLHAGSILCASVPAAERRGQFSRAALSQGEMYKTGGGTAHRVSKVA